MERHNKLYIAYGSNLNVEQMAKRCPKARIVGTTTIYGYQLLFRGGYESAVATIEPMKASNVPVLVWEITPADEVSLDRYEGFPFLYRKENLKVHLNNEEVTAMVYIMNDGRPLGTPNCYYYSTILEGYKTAGFDVNILREAVSVSARFAEGESFPPL